MTKNELMEMARDNGVLHWAKVNVDSEAFSTSLQYMANAILERAAVECEEFGFNEDRPFDYGARIRALKVDNQAKKGQA